MSTTAHRYLDGASFYFAMKRRNNDSKTNKKVVTTNDIHDKEDEKSFNSVRTSLFYSSRQVYHNGVMKGPRDSTCHNSAHSNHTNTTVDSVRSIDVESLAFASSFKVDSDDDNEVEKHSDTNNGRALSSKGNKTPKTGIVTTTTINVNCKLPKIPSNLFLDTPFSPVDL